MSEITALAHRPFANRIPWDAPGAVTSPVTGVPHPDLGDAIPRHHALTKERLCH